MKDNFSTQSDQYALFRPTYPTELFEYLNLLAPYPENAWDCGTGNGQVARQLAQTFDQVYATDISQSQIDNAFRARNIRYSIQPAEKTDFPDRFFNLIAVGQAIHWFDFDKFYAEVNRTARQDAVLCVLGYGKIEINPRIDAIVSHLYSDTLGQYWDPERRYLEDGYQTIPFPFDEIHPPAFRIKLRWRLHHLIGYLNTWSALKHYIQQNRHNPLDLYETLLQKAWPNGTTLEVSFPLLLRIGKIPA